MTDKRKQRVKQTRTGKGVHPQKAPKNNYFAMLSQTEEGRQKRKEWSARKRKNPGRPKGVPDGYTKETIKPIREKAKQFAEEYVTKKTDIKNEFAKEALTTAVEVMRCPGETKERLAAARLVLEFTEAKPASKSDVTLHQAEVWLEELAAEDDKEETTTSSKEALH